MRRTKKCKVMLSVIWVSLLCFFINNNNLYSQENLDKAYEYYNNGVYDSSACLFEEYLQTNPNDINIQFQLGYAYLKQKNYDKALDKFKFITSVSTNKREIDFANSEINNINKILNPTDSLDMAYSYLDKGDVDNAILLFESYAAKNPTDTKVYMQLGYIYNKKNDFKKSIEKFHYVINNSTDPNEIEKAKNQIAVTDTAKKIVKNPDEDLDVAYTCLNTGETAKAVTIFENYLKKNPYDTKVSLQLGYIYYSKDEYKKSIDKFNFVIANSKEQEEIDKAKRSVYILKQLIPMFANSSFDLYFYNIYDSHQENGISNLLSHFNFKLTTGLYAGPYTDIYLDTKSKTGYVYNDRYFEVGGFFKYYLLPELTFEVRTGYVRELDFNTSKFNVKPILTFGTRIGSPDFYKGPTSKKASFLFLDIYSTALYDLKFENAFGALQTKETFRFLTGGYSYFDIYLCQIVQGDTKQLNYNNYTEVGGGIGFQPGIIGFPTLFVEVTNRFYFAGTFKDSFQIKAGFLLNFNLGL